MIRSGIALTEKGEKMPDYEEMILALQDDVRDAEDGACDGDCDYCRYRMTVPGSDERIDREPWYYCGLYDEVRR